MLTHKWFFPILTLKKRVSINDLGEPELWCLADANTDGRVNISEPGILHNAERRKRMPVDSVKA